MTDRDNAGGGGLTGATGDLTADAPERAFEPGERREVTGPDRARVTGYGSGHGLSPEDPAYAMEVHPPAGLDDRPAGETRLGGDERSDREERF